MENMNMGISEDTPWNINIPQAGALAGVLAGFLFLMTVRHGIITWRRGHPSQPSLWKIYTRTERYIINKCSYTIGARKPFIPPIGCILIVLAFISAALPLLLVDVDLAINANRAGFLVLAIVPFILGSAGKYSAVALITGISPIKVNFFHRLLGIAAVVSATVHMSTQIQSWARFPLFLAEQLSLTKVHYGLAGYSCLLAVFVGSVYPVRKYIHEAFVLSHLLAFGFIGAIAKHTPYAMRYFMGGLICYTVNALAGWFVKSYIAKARVQVLQHRCTRLSLRLSSPIAQKPGQSVYICIPAISVFQWHPFTVTNVQAEGKRVSDMVELHVCVRGNFTRAVYEKADPSQEWTVFVCGPAGNSVDIREMLASHETIALMNGGAGVTFGIRLLRELASAVLDNPPMTILVTKSIHFCWSVRDAAELEWFENDIIKFMDIFDSVRKSNPRIPELHTYLHVTGESKSEAEEIEKTQVETQDFMRGCEEDTVNGKTTIATKTVFGRRIDTYAFLRSLSENNLGIYACGPTAFNADIKNAVASLSHWSKSPYLHCDEFEY
ncbi:hypothetical protein EC973_008279 [Apophysomyces ossiformis]|uniref:ferric-chelate reductase (NADPH) n=1 Tax=Apophysomyces ossiformis TaxID=679940 RepID=A0A8H7C0I5_9FUNG|nr:hypothetical protein EC973_008279 [Apophysomyces ossiformis]